MTNGKFDRWGQPIYQEPHSPFAGWRLRQALFVAVFACVGSAFMGPEAAVIGISLWMLLHLSLTLPLFIYLSRRKPYQDPWRAPAYMGFGMFVFPVMSPAIANPVAGFVLMLVGSGLLLLTLYLAARRRPDGAPPLTAGLFRCAAASWALFAVIAAGLSVMSLRWLDAPGEEDTWLMIVIFTAVVAIACAMFAGGLWRHASKVAGAVAETAEL